MTKLIPIEMNLYKEGERFVFKFSMQDNGLKLSTVPRFVTSEMQEIMEKDMEFLTRDFAKRQTEINELSK